ncbi:CarD family transcriptional regulator [Roseburia sp. 499]|uniref:CarD family transcriptional regulator n=1 Tax=Roseburia sp. 499 TaxID=1261634 RepID=UPI0009522157|nr:CarD family transcriptional regulator [Roseburia sp. 499]WVK68630.1 CarD family transcriptional regulator [Roseburia sp. 499]
MFQTGDYMIYGNSGVCQVESVGTIDTIPGIPKDKIYYTLKPLYIKGSTIYTPVDNQKVLIRPLILKEEAMQLIDGIEEIETLWISNEKQREEVYKEELATCDCKELIKIIKTVYQRMQERLAEGKKITNSDRKYFKIAQDSLYGELAIVLDMEKEKVEEFITERMQRKAMEIVK